MSKHTHKSRPDTAPAVGRPVPHDAAVGHVAGDAPYIDDIPPQAGEVWVTMAGSPVARGTIESIDLDEARRVPGVVAIFTAADIPGHNVFGPIVADEPFLADSQLSYLEQPVAVIASTTREAGRMAARLVRINAREESPALTIDEALARGEFLTPERVIARGDFAPAFAAAPHRLEGVFRIGGQEQFYLESQACIAYPGEQGRIIVDSSTQNPTETQAVVAEALGLSMNQVVCVCRRMGGGFGGKETQGSLPAAMTALVASKLRRSARCVYSKDTDMRVTGKRHGYRVEYQVGFDDTGRISAARFVLHSDGGAFVDLSPSILDRSLFHIDNAYYLPNIEARGRVCRTNLPPNTAFRGFGGPQGVAAIENVMEEIAAHLRLDALDVRRANLYGGEGRNTTPYSQRVEPNTLPAVLDRAIDISGYDARRREVDAFNAASRTHLRGLSLSLVKFGISFTTRFLNQGNALVNVYLDGSIQVSTGATEMGQGVNTKIRQIVADEFGLPVDAVVMMATSTEKNINTSPTAASASTDLNGCAALDACRQIRARMAAYAASVLADEPAGIPPDPAQVRFERGHVHDARRPSNRIAFGDLAAQCRRARVDLGARGFYATPGLDYDPATNQGNPFYYFTTGAAVSEVLIDRFTGELAVERVDLVMDIGRSINPGVDRGQVIGGFIQGMGWTILEELVYAADGRLLSDSPTTYKIPGIGDLPRVFHVEFLDDASNSKNIYSSKAVGEPPLLLGISPWAAVKNAIGSLAAPPATPLRLPATGEEILRCLTESAEAVAAGQPAAATAPAPDLVSAK